MFTCPFYLNKVGKRISWPWKPHKALGIRLCRDVRAFTLAQETGKMGSAVCGIKEVLLPSRQPQNQHLSV